MLAGLASILHATLELAWDMLAGLASILHAMWELARHMLAGLASIRHAMLSCVLLYAVSCIQE